MLRYVGERLSGCVREADLVVRLGGDEFAVVLDAEPYRAEAMGLRMLAAVEMPFTIGIGTVTVGASIGVAAAMEGETPSDLLRNADVAMYAAKAAGGSCQVVYAPAMHAAVAERLQLESELRLTWMSDAFYIAYQPIVDLRTKELVGVEALLRWQSPQHGSIPPAVFIPIAEQIGAIVPLGARILHLACGQLATWQRRYGGATELSMSVNVSPRQLFAEDFVDLVLEALRSSGIRPESLILEVTETDAMEHLQDAVRVLNRIRALGVRIALDDFGVGSSSLARLRELPIDIVKIDKGLIDHVPD
jgi:predicted signal transduction protein with EAL and GGDEF domain